MTLPDTQAPASDSVAAVRKYVDSRTGMRGLDPDEINAIDVGCESEARLTLTDLREAARRRRRPAHRHGCAVG